MPEIGDAELKWLNDLARPLYQRWWRALDEWMATADHLDVHPRLRDARWSKLERLQIENDAAWAAIEAFKKEHGIQDRDKDDEHDRTIERIRAMANGFRAQMDAATTVHDREKFKTLWFDAEREINAHFRKQLDEIGTAEQEAST